MNIYLISQDENNDYDTYDSAVVAAESKEAARMIHPCDFRHDWDGKTERYGSWCDSGNVKVDYLGMADPSFDGGVICASFNAG